MSFIIYGFLQLFLQYLHTQAKKKNCLAYWNLQTWSLQTEGKIIPTACLTRRPVHLPNFKNMEMNVIDRLAPIWTFIHHRLIALLQAQISSTFLANNHHMPKKSFIIICCCRNLGYMFFGYHQKMCRCLRGNVMESKTLAILINDFGWDFPANHLPEDGVAARLGDLSLGDLICHLCLPRECPAGEKVGRRLCLFLNWVVFCVIDL